MRLLHVNSPIFYTLATVRLFLTTPATADNSATHAMYISAFVAIKFLHFLRACDGVPFVLIAPAKTDNTATQARYICAFLESIFIHFTRLRQYTISPTTPATADNTATQARYISASVASIFIHFYTLATVRLFYLAAPDVPTTLTN